MSLNLGELCKAKEKKKECPATACCATTALVNKTLQPNTGPTICWAAGASLGQKMTPPKKNNIPGYKSGPVWYSAMTTCNPAGETPSNKKDAVTPSNPGTTTPGNKKGGSTENTSFDLSKVIELTN